MSASTAVNEFRAAGTDLSERRRTGVSRGAIIDLVPSPETSGIVWGADGAARIGASTSIASVAADAQIARAYPGLAAAAGGLATPQIRHLATVGGNLAQRSRCWYFRNPHFSCYRKGGSDCPSRAGNHLYGVAFDLGPCVAPHPSTLAAALLAYDATVTTDKRSGLSIGDVLGDGSHAASDHMLGAGEIVRSIQLPPPLAGERAFYKRAISRTHAEWPLVEVVVRATVSGGKFDVRSRDGGRHRAGAAAPGRRRTRGDRCCCDGGNGGRRCAACDRRCKAAADDGLQARSAAGPRARSAGPVCRVGGEAAILPSLRAKRASSARVSGRSILGALRARRIARFARNDAEAQHAPAGIRLVPADARRHDGLRRCAGAGRGLAGAVRSRRCGG